MRKNLKENKYFQIGLTAFIVIAAAIVFYFLIFKLGLIYAYLKVFIGFFTPFIIGFIFAYLLNPIVNFFNKKVISNCFKNSKLKEDKKNKLINNISIFVTIIIFLGIIILLFSFILPELLKSIEKIGLNMPSYINEAKNYLLARLKDHEEIQKIVLNNYDAINNYLTNILNTKLLPQVEEWLVALSDGVFGAVKIIFNIVMGFVISIYYLADKKSFINGTKRLTYAVLPVKSANKVIENARHTDFIFGNFIIGKLLDGAVIGFITFVFLTIFGYPYSLLIGVLIGVTNMIPYFGPYIGTIPSALLILMDSPAKCLVFVLFIIALQQVDSYLIEPRLCGSRTGLKSFWVLASILLFGNAFGIVGMLVAVPVFALIYGYLDNKIINRLRNKKLPTENEEYGTIERINSETNKVVTKK